MIALSVWDPPDRNPFHPFVNVIFFFEINSISRIEATSLGPFILLSRTIFTRGIENQPKIHFSELIDSQRIFLSSFFALAVVQSVFIAFALQCNLHAYHFL